MGIKSKHSKKTGIYIALHKELRKGVKVFCCCFLIEMTLYKIEHIYSALLHFVLATMLK